MGAALAVGVSAQAPVLSYVKSIPVPILGNDVLNGHFITAVAADGTNLFYTGTGNTANANYETPLVKVADWTKPVAPANHVVIFKDNNGVPATGGALGGWQVQTFAYGGNLYFATSLGSTNTSRNGTEIYRLDYNGNLVFSGAGNFFDGVLNMSPSNEFITTAGSSFQDFAIDPGFGGSPTPMLAHVISGSRSVRRNTLTDGATATLLGHNVNLPSARSIAFDSAGNMLIHHSNSIYRAVRTAANGDTFTGFSDPTIIFAQTSSTAQFPNIEVIPGDSGSDEFAMATDYTAPSGTGKISFFRASDGSTAGYPAPITGTPAGAFASRVQNFATTKIGSTRYIFITNQKAGSLNAVDVYQIGEDGKVTLNVNLNNYDGVPTGGRTVTVQVRDASTDALLDSQTLVTPTGSPATGSLTFYTTARGNVKITAKANGFLRNSFTANAGATPITGTLALTTGDVDNTGEIDAVDIDLVIAAFGNLPTVGDTAPADVDGSGEVDAVDIDIVIANFGATDI